MENKWVVVSSEEEGMEVKKTEQNTKEISTSKVSRFLPRMLLRVLLVEADDSTRQIIAALLRKCSHTVAAVSDGLKAWETLKRRPHSIDLILTEVELPSISGYALLALIMEHDICKNIPVIMMSSHDSISVVLKCMLKGAADFLIKPVRRNELKNLWQHVWRRQSQTTGHVPENAVASQHKVRTTSETNTASNHSSDCLASTQKNKECCEKGSDAQSACTTCYLEAESAYMQNMQGLSQMKCGSASSLSYTECHGDCVKLENSFLPKTETGGKSIGCGPEVVSCNEGYTSSASRFGEDPVCTKTITMDPCEWSRCRRENDNIMGEIHCRVDEFIEPPSAIDLISKFENHPVDINGSYSANASTDKFSVAPYLELSLRRCYPNCSKDVGADELHILNHSNASAFSWYDNSKALEPLFPTMGGSYAELREGPSTSHNQLTNQLPEKSFGTSLWHGAVSQENTSTTVVSQSGQVEAALPGSQLGLIPYVGVRSDSLCAGPDGYDQIFHPIFYTQAGYPPVWSPKSAGQGEHSMFPMSSPLHSCSQIHKSEQGDHALDETANHSADQIVKEEDHNVESTEGLRHSLIPGVSANSSLCNGVASKLNSSVCGRLFSTVDDNATLAAAVAKATASQSSDENHILFHDGLIGMDSRCSTQREAALLKFRLKRKDRCFEKKVRYQSRKRLAEQRPRVKGQFVRQV